MTIKIVLSLILLTVSNAALAGILWKCQINGQINTNPVRDGDTWTFMFKGTKFSEQDNDFCQDWLNREASVELTHAYFTKLGRPIKGQHVLLTEFLEENDYGQGLMQWRYFDRGYTD